MVSGGSGKKDDSAHPSVTKSDHGSSAAHGTKKDHPLPHGQHEVPPYAFKGAVAVDKRSDAFWHPAPRDMTEAPVHFQKNVVQLELHLGDPRQRLSGMTDAERNWRKKFLDDQNLAPEEPVYIPQFLGNFNPFRRIYRWPWDTLERRVLIPAMGFTYGHYVRVFVPKIMLSGLIGLWLYYHFKYHQPAWWDYSRAWVVAYEPTLVREKEIREKEPGLIEKAWKQTVTKQSYREYDFKDRWSHLQIDPPFRP